MDGVAADSVAWSGPLRPFILDGRLRAQQEHADHGGEEEGRQPPKSFPIMARLIADHRYSPRGSPPDDPPALRGGVPDNRAAFRWDYHDSWNLLLGVTLEEPVAGPEVGSEGRGEIVKAARTGTFLPAISGENRGGAAVMARFMVTNRRWLGRLIAPPPGSFSFPGISFGGRPEAAQYMRPVGTRLPGCGGAALW